jgi:hypothetical protein
MILKRKVQWNPELNLNKNSKVLMEAKVTEYSRSLLLMILDDLILTEGQDLKSEQWILEPLANMVIAFSIMDTGVKRYLQLKPNTKLNMEMLEVLKVSIAEKSKELNAIAEVYDDWQEETGVKVIAVSIDDSRNAAKVAPFANGKDWPFEIYLDTNSDLKRALNVNAIPHTFLLNANKEIVWQHTSSPSVKTAIIKCFNCIFIRSYN